MVLLTQMLGICFFRVEDPSAYDVVGSVVRDTKPAWDVEMLRALMAFPIGLAAEGFGTVWKCAAVWAFVAFLVLPDDVLLDKPVEKIDGG